MCMFDKNTNTYLYDDVIDLIKVLKKMYVVLLHRLHYILVALGQLKEIFMLFIY